jgi:hypothetical protein
MQNLIRHITVTCERAAGRNARLAKTPSGWLAKGRRAPVSSRCPNASMVVKRPNVGLPSQTASAPAVDHRDRERGGNAAGCSTS